MLEETGRDRGAPAYCLPAGVEVEHLIARYVSESRLYPEVLDTPAALLILGMLIKFYGCRAA